MFNILVTDDEQIVIDSLSYIISKNFSDNTKIFTALSGTEAIEIVMKENIDIIFMDINMPGLSGLETVNVITKLKPNIVFFGEMPLFMDKINQMLETCDIFLAVGTSGIVYPAAGFVSQAKYYGAKTYLFNLEDTSNNFYFDAQIIGKASETLPEFLKNL